ncbi:MAG: hypothetical protein WC683_09350 [bacterium]
MPHLRHCPACDRWRRLSAYDGSQRTCRECRRSQIMRATVAREALSLARRSGKPCPACCGLSWRVKGPRCRACGLLYAEEAPQMVEFRHDSALAAAVEE